jgi:hypothetical protein
MKAAFLFEETCPNYDLTLQVVGSLQPEERDSLDSTISTGLWGLGDPSMAVAVHTLESLKTRGFSTFDIRKTPILRLSDPPGPLVLQGPDL